LCLQQRIKVVLKERTMKKTVLLAIALAFLSFIIAQPAQAQDPVPVGDPVVKILYAGQTWIVGEVRVQPYDDGSLRVTYDLDVEDCEGLGLTETHLQVGDLGDVINKKGLPKIGHFEYSNDHDPAVSEFTYEIPAGEVPAGSFQIAAHAVVGNGLCELCDDADLELEVTATVDYPGLVGPDGPVSFFSIEITAGGLPLGTYPGWCADIEHSMSLRDSGDPDDYPIVDLLFKAYSTCSDEPLPAEILGDYGESGGIDYPENFDQVNWILNNVAVGDDNGNGPYTFGDIQRAIWYLLEDDPIDDDDTPFDPDRVQEILDMAEENGIGFVPGCCEVVAVILAPLPLPAPVWNPDTEQYDPVPDEFVRQLLIIPFPAPCCETAWADGILFAEEGSSGERSGSWATWFWFPAAPID
jgi:hypothetical protein